MNNLTIEQQFETALASGIFHLVDPRGRKLGYSEIPEGKSIKWVYPSDPPETRNPDYLYISLYYIDEYPLEPVADTLAFLTESVWFIARPTQAEPIAATRLNILIDPSYQESHPEELQAWRRVLKSIAETSKSEYSEVSRSVAQAEEFANMALNDDALVLFSHSSEQAISLASLSLKSKWPIIVVSPRAISSLRATSLGLVLPAVTSSSLSLRDRANEILRWLDNSESLPTHPVFDGSPAQTSLTLATLRNAGNYPSGRELFEASRPWIEKGFTKDKRQKGSLELRHLGSSLLPQLYLLAEQNRLEPIGSSAADAELAAKACLGAMIMAEKWDDAQAASRLEKLLQNFELQSRAPGELLRKTRLASLPQIPADESLGEFYAWKGLTTSDRKFKGRWTNLIDATSRIQKGDTVKFEGVLDHPGYVQWLFDQVLWPFGERRPLIKNDPDSFQVCRALMRSLEDRIKQADCDTAKRLKGLLGSCLVSHIDVSFDSLIPAISECWAELLINLIIDHQFELANRIWEYAKKIESGLDETENQIAAAWFEATLGDAIASKQRLQPLAEPVERARIIGSAQKNVLLGLWLWAVSLDLEEITNATSTALRISSVEFKTLQQLRNRIPSISDPELTKRISDFWLGAPELNPE